MMLNFIGGRKIGSSRDGGGGLRWRGGVGGWRGGGAGGGEGGWARGCGAAAKKVAEYDDVLSRSAENDNNI